MSTAEKVPLTVICYLASQGNKPVLDDILVIFIVILPAAICGQFTLVCRSSLSVY